MILSSFSSATRQGNLERANVRDFTPTNDSCQPVRNKRIINMKWENKVYAKLHEDIVSDIPPTLERRITRSMISKQVGLLHLFHDIKIGENRHTCF